MSFYNPAAPFQPVETQQPGFNTANSQAYYRHSAPNSSSFGDNAQWNTNTSTSAPVVDYSNEPPLLEELGINFAHIQNKVTAVLFISRKMDQDIMKDSDLAGPLVFVFGLGFFMLLSGKLNFGYIYGFGMLCCIAMYFLLNLMSKQRSLDLSHTFSVMGYSLLPIVILAALRVAFDLRGYVGGFLGVLTVVWCTLASSLLFESALGSEVKSALIFYPVFLCYACFALMTIF